MSTNTIQPPETELPCSIDLSHHLNEHSKARHPSPLKEIIKFMGYEGMVSLAGGKSLFWKSKPKIPDLGFAGLPHPSLFPFQKALVNTYPSSTVLGAHGDFQGILDELVLTKEARPDQLLSLSTALQYGGGTGDVSLCTWAHEFTKIIFKPAYSDFEVILNSGNTDAWCKVVRLLCEPGDFILCEQYTYPSAQALWIPMGCKAAPVKIDGRGLRPEDLERVLAEWDEVRDGCRRPRLLYLVPVGSNPTGLTMDRRRRKEIYGVCVKYGEFYCGQPKGWMLILMLSRCYYLWRWPLFLPPISRVQAWGTYFVDYNNSRWIPLHACPIIPWIRHPRSSNSPRHIQQSKFDSHAQICTG